MKGETILASIAIDCATCSSRATKHDIPLYSEHLAHIMCMQCGYAVLEIIFAFEHTNLGLMVSKRPPWKTDYDTPKCVDSLDTLVVTFRSRLGKISIAIDGNQ